jgi:hypothetical protein
VCSKVEIAGLWGWEWRIGRQWPPFLCEGRRVVSEVFGDVEVCGMIGLCCRIFCV